MKQWLVIMAFIILIFSQNSLSQTIKLDNLGLISDLVYIKDNSENLFSLIANDSCMNSIDKGKLLPKYINVKTQVDQFVFQLNADIRTNGCLKLYKRINKDIIRKKASDRNPRTDNYIKQFHTIESSFADLVSTAIAIKRAKKSEKALNPDLMDSFTGIAGLVHGVIKDMKEAHIAKMDKITEVLALTRLCPVRELLNDNKKD
jgi:hypothetical protein